MTAEDASWWAESAAQCMADARKAGGALSNGGAADFSRSVVSTFRYGIPEDMRVWRDSAGGWLWVKYAEQSRVRVRGGFLDAASDIDQWAAFVAEEFSGAKVSWCTWGEEDTLKALVDAIEAKPSSIVLGAPLSSLKTATGASGAWLRPMGAGELMRFKVAAANELGVALAASDELANVDEARREVFTSIENELSDGVASPGHRLYSVCYDGQTVGGAWLEIDSGVAVVRSVVLDSEARGQGHRRATLIALAAAAHMEGARQMQTTIIPPSNPLAAVLREMGMTTLSTNYTYAPEPALAHMPALQNA